MSKMDPKMGAQTRSFFGRLASFFRARRPWEPKWLPSLPQEPPRPVQASIPIDFWLILDDFLMIFCIMWATFYLASGSAAPAVRPLQYNRPDISFNISCLFFASRGLEGCGATRNAEYALGRHLV